MGEVYRARDTRLSREVALKVLPGELSSETERLSRFEQEARSASALNHPHIVVVYDIGRSDSTAYIAMELVDGKSLRELLSGDRLPLKKILQIASQVADGLAKAHGAGIVHRDLKPENLMVSRDGYAKILDFGLAKLTAPSPGDVSGIPTMIKEGTAPGTILGTVGYMSPEQAGGQLLDFRSDQFSFGSILYEMATGCRAFSGSTAVDTMSAILHEEPKPVGALNPAVPRRYGGSWSAVSPRTPRSGTPRRAISRATSRACGITSRRSAEQGKGCLERRSGRRGGFSFRSPFSSSSRGSQRPSSPVRAPGARRPPRFTS